MAAQQKIILVTGGNGGIGYELVAQMAATSSNHVLLGSRSVEKGSTAVDELSSKGLAGTVELLQLDVTDEKSIAEAVKQVESKHGRLDALVNNAGVSTADGTLTARMNWTFQVNATGPAAIVEAFEPLLKKSTGTVRIVNVSSGAGSITTRLIATNPFYEMKVVDYRVSKAALNMVTACQAAEYGKLGWKVFAFCPGYTVSKLSNQNTEEYGAQPTSKGAAPIVDILNGKRDEEHGRFLNATGQFPW
ncbi:NAD(P)-binding protein [Microthyrium microscopicum]|uniref:NAD(P)-binding protein n=1 Tax=Microthyrium microscopicum TaxID=703497 RepID=A0A6A6UPG2_9PEZI|nr:NAD(P)-binding protein [Microthyrium microscopicum]